MPKKIKKLGNLDIFRALQSTNAENHSRWKKIMQKNLCGGWAPITREYTYIGRYSC